MYDRKADRSAAIPGRWPQMNSGDYAKQRELDDRLTNFKEGSVAGPLESASPSFRSFDAVVDPAQPPRSG